MLHEFILPSSCFAMLQSDLTPSNQSSNLTLGNSNATLTTQRKLSKGIEAGDYTITFPPPTYKVKVKFDSVKVQETHDHGIFSSQGDGEYDLYAFV
ncbi:MAG TPA: hypothetical protein VH415_08880 [Nitrososphaeraceae archaeon]